MTARIDTASHWAGALLGRAAAFFVLAAALANMIAGCAALLARTEPRLVAFADAAPLFLISSGFLLLVAWAARLGKIASVCALLGFLAPLAIMGVDLALAARQQLPLCRRSGPELKLVTINLWNRNYDHSRFKAMIEQEKPDIIIASEVYWTWIGTLRDLAPDYEIVAGCLKPHECDVVIVSRFPEVDPLDLDRSSLVDARLALPEELGGGVLDVVGVHAPRSPPLEAHIKALADIEARARRLNERGLLAGDFNATPWSGRLSGMDRVQSLDRQTRALTTWPTPSRPRWRVRSRLVLHAPFPLAAIDHVYAGKSWRLSAQKLGPDIGSDHFPVITTLTPAGRCAR